MISTVSTWFIRKQTEKTIVWANAVAKHKYNERHLTIDLQINSFFFHHGYTILVVSNEKLNQQRVEPFEKNKLYMN